MGVGNGHVMSIHTAGRGYAISNVYTAHILHDATLGLSDREGQQSACHQPTRATSSKHTENSAEMNLALFRGLVC